MKMQAPFVNINGTDGIVLLAQYVNALEALGAASSAVALTCPHGRDFIGKSKENAIAIDQHRRRILALDQMMKELQDIGEQISDQIG